MGTKHGQNAKTSGMADIKDLIQDFIDENGLNKESELEKIKVNWESAAGDFAPGTSVYKFDKKKVFVYAANSVVMSELTYRKKEIIRKLNLKVGKDAVKDIVCRLQR
ncbi:MAG: DUF721 domain-containing protein [Spirochaetia bacterium]|nr:DUF721 domain-containing protein [Spirochaetia bacterium]